MRMTTPMPKVCRACGADVPFHEWPQNKADPPICAACLRANLSRPYAILAAPKEEAEKP